MILFQLVYASSAVRPMPPSDLDALLEAARAKNDRLGVTGMLLYHEARFVQVLEGREQTVRRLYDAIRRDGRHTAVIPLRERLVDAREFTGCAMGFADLSRTGEAVLPSGDALFVNDAFTPTHFRERPGQVHQTLLSFRDAVAS